VTAWLLLDVKLHFRDEINTKFPPKYWPDLAIEDCTPYYGMHFVSAPDQINPGDQITARVLIRAFPEDQCAGLQPGTKVFVKEGSQTIAEGDITTRIEHEGIATTVVGILEELSKSQ
jgi:hypothetical protein